LRTDLAKIEMKQIKGIAASPGIALGRLRVIDRRHIAVDEYTVAPEGTSAEIDRLKAAILCTREELSALKQQLQKTVGDEHLFFIDTHLMILSDEKLFSEASANIETGLINAECALRRALHRYREIFAGIEDSYLRERINDVETVIEKILRNMVGVPHTPIVADGSQTIIVGHDFSPADLLQLDRNRIIGMVTEIGGKTSHASILARAFELPALAGVDDAAELLPDGAAAILDGHNGLLFVNPDRATFVEYLQRQRRDKYLESELMKLALLSSETSDGHRIALRGNVEVPEEGASVLRHGGEGIGLYRTEMLFMNRSVMPDEEEQFQVYKAMLQTVHPYPLTVRTLDAGGDKLLEGRSELLEQNPALGVRAIRMSLSMPEEFKKQLRAILRVSAYGCVKILLPMISGLEELRNARKLLEDAKSELAESGIEFDRNIQTGVMIEIPSAVVVADLLARECDFFSVGTNDLIQYSLAVDRTNEHLSDMYQPLHPAILRSLRQIVSAARKNGIDACICGEMAGDPNYLPVLLGLGYNELSMGAASILRVKQLLRQFTKTDAESITEACFGFSTAAEVEVFLKDALSRFFAENTD
jgi:phosphoenolpyruvate-protein phosphotransferase (PTS system enzyme I)